MKTYLIEAEIGEELPYYTFVIKAENQSEAEKIGLKIAQHDYPLNAEYHKIAVTQEMKKVEDIIRWLEVDMSVLED